MAKKKDPQKEAARIVADLTEIAKVINELSEYNNKITLELSGGFIPGAETIANNFVSDAGILHFKKSTEAAKKMAELIKSMNHYIKATADMAENIAYAELWAAGIKVKRPPKPKPKTEQERLQENIHRPGKLGSPIL